MKKSVWLVAAGTMFLVGCQSETVMDQRHFVPVAENDPAPMETGKQIKPIAATETQVKNVESAPVATTAFKPMEGVKSSGGVSSICPASDKDSVYVIKSGDTLGKIAKQHGIKLSDLMAANNLSEKDAKRLYVGKKLTIPAGGKVVASAKNQAKGAAAAVEATAALDKDGFYVVKSGDTPEKIARRNKIKLADLMKANNLTQESARRLQVGDKLIIPGKSAATAVLAVKAASEAKTGEQEITPAVTAESGEVAPVENTTEVAPAEPESVEETDISLVQEESISIADFCKKYGISEEEFRLHNRNATDPLLQGTTVFIKKK